MTLLKKPVTRKTQETYHNGGKPRRLVIQLAPGEQSLMYIWELGRRQKECVRLGDVYRRAIQHRVAEEQRLKKASKKRKIHVD